MKVRFSTCDKLRGNTDTIPRRSSFESVGIYVVMFVEIQKTLLRVLIIFSVLIIAFGLSFYILLSNVSRAGEMILGVGGGD